MRKVFVTVFTVFVALAAVFGASACSCGGVEQTGYAYGLVHNYYVGSATVKRNGDRVISVKFEETEGLASWGKKTNIKESAQNGVEFTTGGFAKKVGFGAVTFTATDDAATKTPAYKMTDDGQTFEEWVKKEENAKSYVESMANGDYRIYKSDGSVGELDFSVEKNNLKKGERWLKSKNGYWSGSNYPLGWQGNMNKMSDYLIRNGFSGYTGEEEISESGWTVDGVATGATLTDFHDYMKLAKRAYDSAM